LANASLIPALVHLAATLAEITFPMPKAVLRNQVPLCLCCCLHLSLVQYRQVHNTTMGEFELECISDALRRVSASRPCEGIVAYPFYVQPSSERPQRLLYAELLHIAETNAARLLRIPQIRRGISSGSSVVVVHFEDALDAIVWYWSVLLAGGTPCVTTPSMFSQSPANRQQQLKNLSLTLDQPVILTKGSHLASLKTLDEPGRINILTIEEVGTTEHNYGVDGELPEKLSDIALISLTSGSSGQAKAVPIRHRQLFAAFRGKAQVAPLSHPVGPFLSWVNMDHVANLVHCHLFAIASGVSQVQVPAWAVTSDPFHFLNLLSRHKVSRTFAPNFLLVKLERLLKTTTEGLDPDLNLQSLYIDTGGEPNAVDVCVSLQSILSRFGAPRESIHPSFGMTETCGGCIFNNHCPSYDVAQGLNFTSLGKCMPGISMRIAPLDAEGNGDVRVVGSRSAERGHLEIKGEVVCEGYLNNPEATSEAFTEDGWFRTGDLGYLDSLGCLQLDGRSKEVININGVKHLPSELDAILEQAEIPGAVPSYFCCFGTWDAAVERESVHVLYLPSYAQSDLTARREANTAISRLISLHTQTHPRIIPLEQRHMVKSSLGKLSRTKLQRSFERGEFAEQEALNDERNGYQQLSVHDEAATAEEKACLAIVSAQLGMKRSDGELYADESILHRGATSMDLISIIHVINTTFNPSVPMSVTDILRDPTVKGLAGHIAAKPSTNGGNSQDGEYDPVVVLQPFGSKAPLWLVHPGVGEVLVFVNLASKLLTLDPGRPVYAFRARGFNASKGETPFSSLEELIQCYYNAVKKYQPAGPYALAGYSFGGMVAFELTKALEANGDEVRYCGSWNLPPHIKYRMRELDWAECTIHLFFFVGLYDEESAYVHKPALQALDKQGRRLDAIRLLHKHCDVQRWEELGLTEEYYLLWVGIGCSMQGLASNYEPSGTIQSLDVMVADPLAHVAKNRQDWIDTRLAAWEEFVREDVRFHNVGGGHYTMLSAQYVESFAQRLCALLSEREI
jgi:acyl-CoA synthetase (AMP-forming)/AMP-acid ligase II/thioesterase domain-containing protein